MCVIVRYQRQQGLQVPALPFIDHVMGAGRSHRGGPGSASAEITRCREY